MASLQPKSSTPYNISGMKLLSGFLLTFVFIIESFNHVYNFKFEVESLVSPALNVPSWPVAAAVHGWFVFCGLVVGFGFLISLAVGQEQTSRRCACSLCVYLAYVTIVWWLRRGGVWFWLAADGGGLAKIQIMKNAAIFGGLLNFCSGQAKDKQSVTDMLQTVFVATRPWSLTASMLPIAIAALVTGHSNWIVLGFWTASVVTLQTATNLLNSHFDYEDGMDKKPTAGDRTIVDEYLTSHQCRRLGELSVYLSMLFFSLCVSRCKDSSHLWLISGIYICGLTLAIAYSVGLKIRGVGDLSVFLAFGPLLSASTSLLCCTAGPAVSRSVLYTLPVALLIVNILHVNNLRDIVTDRTNNVNTVAVRIGHDASLVYVDVLVFGALLLQFVVSYGLRIFGGSLAVVVLPQMLALRAVVRQSPIPRAVDESAAQLMVLFGVATLAGLAIEHRFMPSS